MWRMYLSESLLSKEYENAICVMDGGSAAVPVTWPVVSYVGESDVENHR